MGIDQRLVPFNVRRLLLSYLHNHRCGVVVVYWQDLSAAKDIEEVCEYLVCTCEMKRVRL